MDGNALTSPIHTPHTSDMDNVMQVDHGCVERVRRLVRQPVPVEYLYIVREEPLLRPVEPLLAALENGAIDIPSVDEATFGAARELHHGPEGDVRPCLYRK